MRRALLLVVLGLAGCGTLLGFEEPTVIDAGPGETASIGFSTPGQLVDETSGEIEIPVVLSAPLGVDVSVRYAQTDGTADGTDFSLLGDTVTIPAGATQGAIALTVVADDIDEDDETIELTLLDPIGPATLGARTHVITISANSLPRVAFTSATSQSTIESSPDLSVVLDRPSPVAVTVEYSVSGTASAPSDYGLAAGKITFPPGVVMQTLDLGVVDDSMDEDTETIVLTLQDPMQAIIGPLGQHTHAILDNDPAPQVMFAMPNNDVGEAIGTTTIGVSLSAASGKLVTVGFARIGGGADLPQDFTFVTTSPLSFPPGTTTANITLSIVNDSLPEANENARIGIGLPSNANVGNPNEHVLTITDND